MIISILFIHVVDVKDVKTVNHEPVNLEPFAKQKNVQNTPGNGRKILAEAAAQNYSRLRRRCPELKTLEDRFQKYIRTNQS